MQIKSKQQQGFSLIEMVVVLSIISTMTMLTIYNLSGIKPSKALEASCLEFKSRISEMQNHAILVAEIDNNAVTGYGINIVCPNTYYLFYNNTADLKYEEGTSQILAETELIHSVKFDESVCDSSIYCKTPEFGFYINGKNESDSLEIILKNDEGESRNINISTIGLIN